MGNRNKFLTFVLAFIPGVGQMYLGLFKKGMQLLALFFLVDPVLSFIGLGFFSEILQIVIWCYAFFDTFETAKKLDAGVSVPDTEYFFNHFIGDQGAGFSSPKRFTDQRKMFLIGGWALIVIGIMAILNLTFGDFELYRIIKSYASSYIVPAALVGSGIWLLSKNRRLG